MIYGTLYNMIFSLYRCAANLQRAAYKILVFLLLVAFGSVLLCSGKSIDLFPFCQKNSQELKKNLPELFELELITYESDIRIDSEEFFYLTGLQKGVTISADDLLRAISYLFKKRKLSRINLNVADGIEGKQLHFSLIGFKTFARLKLHGVLIGKDRYRQYYLMESGDPFDEQKHLCSLQKIRDAFRDEGFFSGTVKDQLSEDQEVKTVDVSIKLFRGPRFFIDFISVSQKKTDQKMESQALLEKVESRLRKRLEKKGYTKQLINQETKSVKQFLARAGFSHIRVELLQNIDYKKKTVSLQFTIDFLEKRQFVFFGNSFFTDQQLLETVFLFGRSVRLIPVSVLGQEIMQQYKQKGFWTALVKTTEEQGRDFFLIKEGKRAVIKSVLIKGVESFTKKQLIKKCFRCVLYQHQFNQHNVQKAEEKLLLFYRQHGFWETRILNKQFICLDQEKQWYSFEIVLEEGSQSFLSAVLIPGFEKLLFAWPFLKYNKQKKLIPFNPEILQQQKQWLQKYFKKKGYNNLCIVDQLIREGNNVSLQWNIDLEKNKIIFGKTIFCGSDRLPFSVIQKQLCYKDGDLFDVQKLRQSYDRLQGMDVFDQIHLYPDRPDQKKSQQDVLLKLRFDNPFEYRVRAGLGLQQVGRHFPLGRGVTYKLGGTFLMKNPTNSGDHFSFDADFTRGFRNVSFDYHRPQFFSIAIATHVRIYANRYEQPGFIGCKKNLYEVLQNGFLVGVRDKCRWFDAGCNIGLEWMQTDIKEGMKPFANAVAQAIQFESDLLEKKLPYFFIEPIFIVDHLDDKLQPTAGLFTLLSCKGMFPLTDKYNHLFFVKLLAEQSFFHSFRQKIVFGLHLRFGHIFHQVFSK